MLLAIGVDFAPRWSFLGAVEARRCVADNVEAMVRVEGGGNGVRLLAGARVRLFEKNGTVDDWGDHVGFEGGAAVELFGAESGFGGHLGLTFGDETRYLALQGLFPLSEIDRRRNRGSLLFGFAPLQQDGGGTPGRPIYREGRALLPPILGSRQPRDREAGAVRRHFARAAQLEYSSVWTFLRLANELAAVGAPDFLVARALDAGDDEVRHAELCGRAAGGLALAPLPVHAARPRFRARTRRALAVLARESWLEGCLNEGIAAEEALRAAEDAVGTARSMLEAIARDEARHAALAWSVLGWVHASAPEIARDATMTPRAEPEALAPGVARVDDDPALARRGVARGEVRRAASASATSDAIARRADLLA